MAERFRETPQQATAQLDTSGAQSARTLANALEAFSARAGQERKEIVVRDAIKKGEEADVSQIKENPFTLADQAFNKGLMTSFMSSLDNDNRETISRFANEHAADPIAFMTKADKHKEAMLAEVPDQLRSEAARNLDSQISRAMIQVQGNAIQEQKNEIQANLENNASDTATESGNLARLGDDLGSAEEFEKYINIVNAMDINEGDKKKMIRAEGVNITQQKYLGEGDRLYEEGGITAVNKWLTKNEGKPRDGTSAQEWDAITDAMQVDANRKESRRRAASNLSKTELRQNLRDYETAKSLGFEVSRESEANLVAQISGVPELVKEKKIIDDTAKFSVLSVEDRADILGAAQTGQLEDVRQYASLVKANEEINKAASRDGYSLGANQGIIEFSPLEVGNQESFALRLEQSEILSEHYGVPVSPLTDSEAEGIVSNLENMTFQEKTELAMTFQQSPNVWNQLDRKNAGAFAMAGATGDRNLMNTVFRGQDLIKNKLVKNLSTNDYLADFDEMVEGVYGVNDRRAVLDATLNYYAASSDRAVEGIYNSSDFEDALQAVTGGIGEVNGFKLELPRGVDEDTFEDFIDDMQPETVRDMGGVAHFSDEQAAQAIQQGRIRSIGSNQYVVENNGLTLFNEKGEPFIIEYSLDMDSTNRALVETKARERRKAARKGRGPR